MTEREKVQPIALSVTEAAAAIGISESKLRELISEREIQVARVGDRVLVPKREIEAFIDRKMV